MSSPNPNEATINSSLIQIPMSKPSAPISCKIMVKRPSFSKPNLLNSDFILGLIK